jgi:tyrosyl-DNA phosphodiesterase-1
LVASVPGRFSATKRIYGMLRMQKLLEDFCIPNANDDDKKDNLIFQFSSIGSLGPNENAWLCGEFKSCLSSCKKENKIQVNPPICVYPTIENVLKSYEGLMAGGSLPYSDTTHEKQKYLENFL